MLDARHPMLGDVRILIAVSAQTNSSINELIMCDTSSSWS